MISKALKLFPVTVPNVSILATFRSFSQNFHIFVKLQVLSNFITILQKVQTIFFAKITETRFFLQSFHDANINLNICCWHLLLILFTALANKTSNVMREIPACGSFVAIVIHFCSNSDRIKLWLSNISGFDLSTHFFRSKNAVVR